eukprot:2503732-Amphidinium_carterae.1
MLNIWKVSKVHGVLETQCVCKYRSLHLSHPFYQSVARPPVALRTSLAPICSVLHCRKAAFCAPTRICCVYLARKRDYKITSPTSSMTTRSVPNQVTSRNSLMPYERKTVPLSPKR